MASNNDPNAGIINPTELYTLTALKRRLGIQDASLRAARRAGLDVRYAHKQGYVHGKDWIEHVMKFGRSSNGGPTCDSRL